MKGKRIDGCVPKEEIVNIDRYVDHPEVQELEHFRDHFCEYSRPQVVSIIISIGLEEVEVAVVR